MKARDLGNICAQIWIFPSFYTSLISKALSSPDLCPCQLKLNELWFSAAMIKRLCDTLSPELLQLKFFKSKCFGGFKKHLFIFSNVNLLTLMMLSEVSKSFETESRNRVMQYF